MSLSLGPAIVPDQDTRGQGGSTPLATRFLESSRSKAEQTGPTAWGLLWSVQNCICLACSGLGRDAAGLS